MKINRTFLALIFAASILFAAAFYSTKIAQKLMNDEEINRQEELRRKSEHPNFWFSHGDELDRHYIDYIFIAAGLFILATATTVAAFRIKKVDD